VACAAVVSAPPRKLRRGNERRNDDWFAFVMLPTMIATLRTRYSHAYNRRRLSPKRLIDASRPARAVLNLCGGMGTSEDSSRVLRVVTFALCSWQEDDRMSSVALWDNIGTVHDAVGDCSADEPRYGRRVQEVMAALDYPRRVA
jgi:hypothetical protein